MDPTAVDAGKRKAVASKGSMDQLPLASAIPRFFSNDANMTNCYDQCRQFFKVCKTIHFNKLIAYWMIAGYLGPVGSVEEACQKGQDMSEDLIQKGMVRVLLDGDKDMIEFVKSEEHLKSIHCKHQGFHFDKRFGYALLDFFDLGMITNIVLTDGMQKQRKVLDNVDYVPVQSSWVFFPNHWGKSRYLAHFNPTLDSVKPLCEIAADLYLLILRGCGELLPPSTFPLEILSKLNVLEISGSSHLTTIDVDTISHLRCLVYLNLSDLLIQTLPDDFFKHFLYLQWLILRGCSKLCSLPQLRMSKLKALDLSHCTSLQEIDVHVSELCVVDLSYTALAHVHFAYASELTHLFLRDSKLSDTSSFNHLTSLLVLDLSGARVVTHTNTVHLSGAREVNPSDTIYARKLEVLDLSRTQIEYVKFCDFPYTNSPLRCMILRECTALKELPSMEPMPNLEVIDVSGCDKLLELPRDLSHLNNLKELNLSGCSGLGILTEGLFDQMSYLLKLDLSGTNIKVLPSFVNLTSLRKLSLRGLELHSLEPLTSLSSLVELDLNGLEISHSCELRLDFLQSFEKLQILNLSGTSVAQLSGLSKLVSLKELLLADCRLLKVVPDLQTLTNLETLDLSLLDESEPQQGIPISAPSSLRKLVLTNRSGLQNLFSLTSLGNLEFLDLRGTDVRSIPRHYMEQVKCIHLPAEKYPAPLDDSLQGGVSKPVEIHIVSSIDRSLIPKFSGASSSNQPSGFDRFQKKITELDALISEMQDNFKSSMVTATTVAAQTFKLEKMRSDLNHIGENIERLKSSKNYKRGEELLEELMDAITHLSASDFMDDPTNLKKLVCIVIKVKLLVPRNPSERPKASEVTKKEKDKSWFKRSKNKQNDVGIVKKSSSHEFRDLLCSYDCLSISRKCCLLWFSVFPLDEDNDKNEGVLKSLVIKKRMLIYLWFGEGFLDPSADMSLKTVEEAGKDILMVLADKGFIEPVMEKGLESGSCCMRPFVHEFVTAKANEESFFDFNQKNGKLTPHFTRSQRACLLKTQENIPSSCKLWENYYYYQKNRESFKSVCTLFNVSESVVDIKPKWFSKMECLRVLHLGSWRSDHEDYIEVYDHKILKDLENMKFLRLLSLRGLSRFSQLPDSVCKLTHLIILDLRECAELEELPTGIGSLNSLTHLDLTNCHRLTELPKGIRLLSKLEVLKGFVITKHGCGPKVCTLKDLLNLKKLRKFHIVVRINIFPNDKELQVLKDMDNLCKLKITWEKDFNFTDEEWFSPEAKDVITEEAMRPSKWKKLKCWKRRSSQDDSEETSRNEHLDTIEKLELWCYPFKTAPYWLNPSELKRLKKLYIGGGNLTKLHCCTNQNKWNITTLRLKYLRNLDMRWRDLKNMFPNLTYLEKHQCPKFPFFPCNGEGVWIQEKEEK